MDQLFTQLIQQELSKHAEAIKSDVLKTFQQQLKERDEKIAMLEEQITARNDISRHEKYYQRKLEELLEGGHAKTKYGEIDILTDTTIYEIKAWKSYKNALGQLLFYAKDYPGRQLAKIFFGRCDLSQKKKKELLEDLRNDKIDVYQVNDELDGSVSLELLNPRPINEPYVISQTSDIPRVITQFISERCNFQKGNKKLRIFTGQLWQKFNEWQIEKKITPQLLQKQFYKAITDKVDYDHTKKVRINNKNSLGWYGICVKESDSEEES